MKVPFNEIFEVKNRTITPKFVIIIGGVEMGAGVKIGDGVTIGNVNLAEHVGKDLEIEKDQTTGVVKILGIYN